MASPTPTVSSPGGAIASNAVLQANSGTINDIVNSVLNLQGQSVEDAANAAAETEAATGATAEATAYGTSGDIATQNAQLEGYSGQVQQYQQMRQANATIGSQQAAISASGFGNSGSSLALLRSSKQQAYLGNQIIGINSQLAQGGYLEQASASTAEQAAATAASSAATTLAAQEATAGTLAHANAINETAALGQVFGPIPAATVAADAATGTAANSSALAQELEAETGVMPVTSGAAANPTAAVTTLAGENQTGSAAGTSQYFNGTAWVTGTPSQGTGFQGTGSGGTIF